MALRLKPPFVLLEDRASPQSGGRFFSDPVEVVRCDAPEAFDAALARVQAGLDRGLHAAGFLAYEAGQALAANPRAIQRPSTPGPLMCIGLFSGVRSLSRDQLDGLFGDVPIPPPVREVRLGHGRDEHVAKVEAIKALIAAGDVYQVNLTFPIHFQFGGDPLALYAVMRVRQPVAHGGVVALGGDTVLSVSPELFVSITEGKVAVRPMKGTAPRAADAAADCAARARLALDPKERAENLMIVDLMRNDLSRVCEVGSVRVPSLFTVETYPTFHTLTSTVTGTLKPGVRLRETMVALFPCGSVVGAPKTRAGEIIAELEDDARGVYTGAVGEIGPDGDLAFNVAIRTAVIAGDGAGRYGVGGGILADSMPDAEYDEALLKGRVLTDLAADFQLIETLRWSPSGGFVRLADHLARLRRSARRLGFAHPTRRVARQIADAAKTWPDGPDRRVRIMLYRDGALDITQGALGDEPARDLLLGVFDQALDEADPFLRHKTTSRGRLDLAASAAGARGLDELVLLNRAGQVADGSRNSIFVERNGCLLTPRVRAGALPGVLRASLIAEGAALEAELPVGDLEAGPVFIGNSLRGLRRCRFVNAG